MSSLPGGTFTFVFTDVEGSTKLLQGLGDDYAEVAGHNRRLVREALAIVAIILLVKLSL